MSIDMNNKSSQMGAIVGVIASVAVAWNLGHKQGLNTTLVNELSDGILIEDSNSTASDEVYATDESVKEEASSIVTTSVNGESVSVRDQLAGSEVQVASLALTEMGWVGVRDNDGRVLGAGRFEAGSYKNVNVFLLRATVAGGSYQGLFYVDDGDKEFDLHKDILISGPNGGVAGTNFKAL